MSCGCVQQAVNITGAVVRIGAAAVTGQAVTVDAAAKAARLAICLTCPAMKISDDGTAHLCTGCGCWLDGIVLCKACLATEDCPQNKWPKIVSKP
jgi:hypothetical protein